MMPDSLDITSKLDSFLIGTAQDFTGLGYAMSLQDQEASLVVGIDERRHVIRVSDWGAWPIREMTRPEIIMPACRIEVDLSSAFDAESNYKALGTIYRRSTSARLFVRMYDQHASRIEGITVEVDLPEVPDRAEVGFSRWIIVVGEGETRRQIAHFDVGRAERPVF